jgi:hypothetical protein
MESGESVFSFFASSLSLNVRLFFFSLSLCFAVIANAFIAGYVTGFDRLSVLTYLPYHHAEMFCAECRMRLSK